MSKRVKVSIDAFGVWRIRGAAAQGRDPINLTSPEANVCKSPTQGRCVVEPSAHRDRACCYGFPSSDPHLDVKTLNHHEGPQRVNSDLGSNADSSTSHQNPSQHSSVAAASTKQDNPNFRTGIRPYDTNSAADQDSYMSALDQGQKNSSTPVLAEAKPTKKPRVPSMLKALYPYNDGPPIGIHPSIGMEAPPEGSDEGQRRVRVTRTLARDHCKRIRSEPESPRKSVTVRHMMRTRWQGETAVEREKTPTRSPASAMVYSSSSRSRSQTLQPVYIFGEIPISRQIEDYDTSYSWVCWEDKKEKISKHFDPANLSVRKMGNRRLMDVDFAIDADGIYVFKPTAQQYSSSFTELLRLMEDTAGHIQGVVKAVVPKECISPYKESQSIPNVLVDFEAPMFSTTLSQCRSAERANLYLVDTNKVGPGPAKVTKILERIQEEEAFFLRKYDDKALKSSNVWRQFQEETPFTETKMMACVANTANTNPWCALDEPATHELKEALECNNIHLGEDKSNGFLQSATVRAGEAGPGLGQSCFHLSTRSGTMFPLQLGDFAAYTLNYHHAGGPRSYTIVKPSSHQRLEEFICLTFQQNKNPKPPPCSQFVSHEAVYIPKETLITNGIEFTEVTQFEQELLIIFPYAYYQGFNGAANVVEEVMYASKQWEVFHREGLYVKCSKDCADGEEDFDLSFAEKQRDDSVESDDDDIRQPASKRQRAC